jgi:hypothetical protein
MNMYLAYIFVNLLGSDRNIMINMGDLSLNYKINVFICVMAV